ncbi:MULTISPECIES: cysteine hydrolase [Citrobacter freundii complex]|jgi:nicotinamidase-related amidase|uniref:Cysteine hydrolase n=2 Tax=Citrobacter freundii complex TaxID=1344959 RepID=A0AAE7L027_CITFR|nr:MULTISPECIES: cysteine hydrolase [Citrobacter freundii complex]NTZ52518.1 cysteine hydrolase [Citrobacter gillenii]QCA17252.1 cysteine hydrolase [Citrobacter freundii]QLO15282.1 cysteine hydrolase [Citrobacter freundii]QLS04945.1 cysteine hydrolase [Citrobacter freundii]QMG39938.1 cysteine hydrolase [Citrobacter freundii]
MSKMSMSEIYSEPEAYGLPRKGITLNSKTAALVVVDPQVDFLSPQGIGWEVFKDSITENNTVENLEALFKLAKEQHLPVFVSPHYYFPHDHKWVSTAPGETFMHSTGMFDRQGPLNVDNFENSGADFMPQFKPYIYDGETVITSPHKIFGPETNDLVLQLRKRGISQVILAGMAANLCIESHLRELIEQGFEVVVVKDATAGPRIPEGDGYLAALTNYRIIANDLWDTEKTIETVIAAAK